ncbi:ATP-binding protein [Bacteroides heparinolyticus]|uniref:AAA family ATPase n=1 Tax=Prevotella heparinolytica TaxID=28113 RepID=UPI0035A0D3F1
MINPFVTNGYAGPEYFCDRIKETSNIITWLCNGNNLALISPRRYGKTDLIRHCFNQKEIKDHYYTFIIDIYSTKSLSEMVNKIGKTILETLKPRGRRHWELFLNVIHSLKTGITYDALGQPSWNVSVGDIVNPNNTLDEIFHYLQQADKRCIVAIDEFQQILKYEDANVEAALRTYVQYCSNANFVFTGSQRHLMGAMFVSPNRPFYQSVTIMNLDLIQEEKYFQFCKMHFEKAGKSIDREVVKQLYACFGGVTFYLQKVMNVLFMQTEDGGCCDISKWQPAIDYIVDFTAPTYEDLMYQLPEKQSLVLKAIAKEREVVQITSGRFAKQHGLVSPSAVKSAVNALLDKDLVTHNKGVYQVYDKFLEVWLNRS